MWEKGRDRVRIRKTFVPSVRNSGDTSHMQTGPLYQGHRQRPLLTFRKTKPILAGIYLSADKRYANSYGTGFEITANVELNNPLEITIPQNGSLTGPVILHGKKIAESYRELLQEDIDLIKKAGYDGIIITLTEGTKNLPWKEPIQNPFEVVVFDQTCIRILKENPTN
jgi:hypothetical protein